MRKLSAWLLKAANWISNFWERCKCKWNKALLFISMTTKNVTIIYVLVKNEIKRIRRYDT